MSESEAIEPQIPAEPLGKLFVRYLHFGILAFGGPVAQIAMIRQEFVEKEKWVSKDRFNRLYAVYQVLPGPEATELCVCFGMLSRGRIGGLLAGLAFMLPGFFFMLGLAALYTRFNLTVGLFAAAFAGIQPAVVALITRAVEKLGRGSIPHLFGLFCALVAFAAEFAGVPFYISLPIVGLAFALDKIQKRQLGYVLLIALAIGACFVATTVVGPVSTAIQADAGTVVKSVSMLLLFIAGLKGGLLTFGGAYTAVPFVRNDVVVRSHWITDHQFLDGFGLSTMVPAPLVIFVTFIGYVAGGVGGACAITAGMFLPAFSFTLIGHKYLEKLVNTEWVHGFLDGIAAAVVGVVAVTALRLMQTNMHGWFGWLVFGLSLAALLRFKSKWTSLYVIGGAAVVGMLASMISR